MNRTIEQLNKQLEDVQNTRMAESIAYQTLLNQVLKTKVIDTLLEGGIITKDLKSEIERVLKQQEDFKKQLDDRMKNNTTKSEA